MVWDKHDLMHMVFEFGEEEGMRRMAELSDEDASSVDFQGDVVQEPRVCLALDELILVTEVRQACGPPEPAKSVQTLFRADHGLGVWNLAAEQSLADWYSGRKPVGGLVGYFPTVGGKILDSGRKVGSLGLGHMAEVVFHRRLLGGSFGGVVKGGCLPGTGEWTCSNYGKTDCWSTRSATGAGFFLGTLMVMAWSKGFLELARAKVLVFRVKGWGWDVWCEIGWCSWA